MNKRPKIDKAVPFVPAIFPAGETVAAPRFDPHTFDGVSFDMRPSYLIKDILPRTGLCIVLGPAKCGKSFLVFDMVMHVALGWYYRGKKVRQGSVVYCALEGCAAFKNRIVAFRQNRLEEHKDPVPFHMIAEPMQLVADHPALIAAIAKLPAPAVIVIDTLNRSLTGSESSDEDMANYVKAADALQAAFKCLVVIVHHCGHEGTRPRGHSSLMGALDAQIAVSREDGGDNVFAKVELLKDGLQGEEFASQLEAVRVGVDIDGDEVTSCIVEPAEGIARKVKIKKLAPGAAKALASLHEILDDAGKVVPASTYIPPGTKAVLIAEWRAHAFKRVLCGNGELKLQQQAFRRSYNALLQANSIAVSDPYVWPL
jgi:AAA domain